MKTEQDTKDEMGNLDPSFLEVDSNVLPPNDIIAYNELRSCSDLFRMYKDKVLNIDPDFQRGEIWPEAQKTRFIDSLIKKLPIPSLCFSLDYNTEKWEVIDGLQRITSIIKFLEDDNWRLSKLNDIDERLSGKLVSEIKLVDKGILYTRLTNLTIPITVLRCDYKKPSHTNYLFTIFHRLNTGGIKLTNQEIRNAIYNGTFNTKLKDLCNNNEWKTILGLKKGKFYRLSKEELILRFFSFYDNLNTYDGTLAKFLNDYMSINRNPSNLWLDAKEKLFNETVSIIYEKIADKKSILSLSNVYVEAVLYGVGKNLNFLKGQNGVQIKSYLNKLKRHEHFSEENIREGLSSKLKVNNRLNTAKNIFSGN